MKPGGFPEVVKVVACQNFYLSGEHGGTDLPGLWGFIISKFIKLHTRLYLVSNRSLPGIRGSPIHSVQPLPQLTVLFLHSQPTFRAVKIGPDQNFTVVQVTENNQELQMQNRSG